MKSVCEIICLQSEVQWNPAYLELVNVASYFQPLRLWESDCLWCRSVSRALSMGLAVVSSVCVAGRCRISVGEEKLQMNKVGMAIHLWRVSEVSHTDGGCLQLATLRNRD